MEDLRRAEDEEEALLPACSSALAKALADSFFCVFLMVEEAAVLVFGGSTLPLPIHRQNTGQKHERKLKNHFDH